MNPLQGSCPSCGAQVKFKVGTSLVAVCEFCRSVVGRGDKSLQDLGKVADVTDSGSPLDLWLKGRYQGVPLDLTGRVQYAHPGGGFWDEWYAHFADGRWGWLAEAQGRFYLTFEQPAQVLPAFSDLKLGDKIAIGPDDNKLLVSEKNVAKAAGAKGEIPYRLEPGRAHPFADLYGPERAFATLDYSDDHPLVYIGREVTLDDLGIPRGVKAGQRDERRIETKQLNCPNCGGALALRAPDQAQRVGCPNCGSLLDVQDGQLELLQSLHPPRVEPYLPLGSIGEIEDTKLTVLGFMQRSVMIEATQYFWTEYLLYEPRFGFRWLVHSDNHWNYVRALPPGEVNDAASSSVTYQGRQYRLFQRSVARVEFVIGEFYWKVQAGEEVQAKDFVAPPLMLSQEVTTQGADGEINWSLGEYRTPAEVERAFNVRELPTPVGVGPNQPFPYSAIYRRFGLMIAAAFAVFILAWLVTPHKKVLAKSFQLAPLADGMTFRNVVTDAEPFDLVARRNVRIVLRSRSPVWVYVDGELAPKNGPRRTAFSLLAGPNASEKVYLNAVPAGDYVLDLKFQWGDPKKAAEAELTVEQGVVHPLPFLLLLGVLAAVPIGVGIYHGAFEARRWQNSSTEEPSAAAEEPEEEAAEVGETSETIAPTPDEELPKWLQKMKRRAVPPHERSED